MNVFKSIFENNREYRNFRNSEMQNLGVFLKLRLNFIKRDLYSILKLNIRYPIL